MSNGVLTSNEDWLNLLGRLHSAAGAAHAHLHVLYGGKPTSDIRVTLALSFQRLIGAVYLAAVHAVENLADPQWWFDHGLGEVVTGGFLPGQISTYTTMLTSDTVITPFLMFEAGLRRLARQIDPLANDRATSNFSSVYKWLFSRLEQDGWAFSNGKAETFLELYRIDRNLIHNDGYFYSRDGQDRSISWRGQIYKFEHGKEPDFHLYDFHEMMVMTLIQLNLEVMSARPVRELPMTG